MKKNNKQILEGSRAVAEVIKNLQPKVVAAYPITPQTHIVEELEKMKAEGKANYEYIRAESEFAAASILLGASAVGSRTYSATCSQGLLLMVEVLFSIAGMRLPVVITCANRAVSSPINIWNDQQDSLTIRDAGWLLFYAETNQEAVDLHILAYKLAEKLLLPVMVNMDGFVLTHTFEPVEIPSEILIKKFLPIYKPDKNLILDVNNPRSLGCFATPDTYMEIRQELHQDVVNSKEEIKKLATEFKKVFKRGIGQNGLIEEYKTKDAEIVFVAMGSVCGTIKAVIDQARAKGRKVGLLKVIAFRPFPAEEIIRALGKAKYIAAIDKAISLGKEGILAAETRKAAHDLKAKIQSFIVGLGGRDVNEQMIKKIMTIVKSKDKSIQFIGK
jgi:pyruvate ferredoxin oxidoreductase alpha subunit